MQPGFKVAKGPPALIVRGVLSGEYLSLPDQKYSSSMIEMLIFHNGSTKKQNKKKKKIKKPSFLSLQHSLGNGLADLFLTH